MCMEEAWGEADAAARGRPGPRRVEGALGLRGGGRGEQGEAQLGHSTPRPPPRPYCALPRSEMLHTNHAQVHA